MSGLELGNATDAAVPSLAMGANVCHDDGQYLLACQMLVDFIAGRIGGQQDVDIAKNIVR